MEGHVRVWKEIVGDFVNYCFCGCAGVIGVKIVHGVLTIVFMGASVALGCVNLVVTI